MITNKTVQLYRNNADMDQNISRIGDNIRKSNEIYSLGELCNVP
jgi:hypothetical protein